MIVIVITVTELWLRLPFVIVIATIIVTEILNI